MLCGETGQEDSEPCRRKLKKHLKRKIRAMPSVHGHGGHSPFLMLVELVRVDFDLAIDL